MPPEENDIPADTPLKQQDIDNSSLASAELKEEVKAAFAKYSRYSKQWSAAYWGFVFGAAILSAVAGIYLKLDATKAATPWGLTYTDVSAILAGAAALFVTISSAGDFNGKWKANRTAKNRAEQLKIDFHNPDITTKEVTTRLKNIVEDQNNGVINDNDTNRQDNGDNQE